MPPWASGKPRPIGVPGSTLCRIDLQVSRRSPHNVQPGSHGERDAVCSPGFEAGRRRAIGVVAALQATHERPRRWCDAGPMGRHSVTADQKAGDEETNHGGPFPGTRLQRDSPIALSESAPSNDVWARNATRSEAVRHPKIGLRRHVRSRPIPRTLQANTPRSFEARRRGASRKRGKPRPSGCRVRICAGTTSRRSVPLRTRSMPGSPGRRDPVCCSGYEAGRRRAVGVVAALSINPRTTTPMVRRWVAGTPERHSGPEGRCRSTAPSCGRDARTTTAAQSAAVDRNRNRNSSQPRRNVAPAGRAGHAVVQV